MKSITGRLIQWLSPQTSTTAPVKNQREKKLEISAGSETSRVIDYINHHIGKPFTSNDISAAMGIDRDNISSIMTMLRRTVSTATLQYSKVGGETQGWRYVYRLNKAIRHKVRPYHRRAPKPAIQAAPAVQADITSLIEARFDDIIDSINDLRKCILRLYPMANVQDRKAANG